MTDDQIDPVATLIERHEPRSNGKTEHNARYLSALLDLREPHADPQGLNRLQVKFVSALLELYRQRKNAQEGSWQITELCLDASKDQKQIIRINASFDGKPLAENDGELWGGLMWRVFGQLQTVRHEQRIHVSGSPAGLAAQLVRVVDSVAVYPLTDQLNVLLQGCGLIKDKRHSCHVLPYPINGKPVGQFQKSDLHGIHTLNSRYIDASMPQEGLIFGMPYSKYSDESMRAVNLTVLALHHMGLRLPFSDAQLGWAENYVSKASRHPMFPEMAVFADGRPGYSSLAGYVGNDLRFVIMEEPGHVANIVAGFLRSGADRRLGTKPLIAASP